MIRDGGHTTRSGFSASSASPSHLRVSASPTQGVLSVSRHSPDPTEKWRSATVISFAYRLLVSSLCMILNVPSSWNLGTSALGATDISSWMRYDFG